MALVTKNLTTNIGGIGMGGPKFHSYTSSEALATIAGSGYFNAAADQIDTGDMIYVFSTAASGGGAKIYQLVNTAGVITTATVATDA